MKLTTLEELREKSEQIKPSEYALKFKEEQNRLKLEKYNDLKDRAIKAYKEIKEIESKYGFDIEVDMYGLWGLRYRSAKGFLFFDSEDLGGE